jgi:hypothetical protein
MSRLFLQKAAQRAASTLARSNPHNSFLIKIWTPAWQIREQRTNKKTGAIPIPSNEAAGQYAGKKPKLKTGLRDTLEPFGHAAAEFSFNIKPGQSGDETLTAKTCDMIQRALGLSNAAFQAFDYVQGFMSLFPRMDPRAKGLETTGAVLTPEQQEALLDGYANPSYDEQQRHIMEKRVKNLLMRECIARIQTPEQDLATYGTFDNFQQFNMPIIHEQALMAALLHMLEPRTEGSAIILDTPHPDITYYGVDILSELAVLSGFREPPERIKPESICFTAILKLIRENIGRENYIRLYREAQADNPEIPPGLICAELLNDLLTKYLAEHTHTLTDGPRPF